MALLFWAATEKRYAPFLLLRLIDWNATSGVALRPAGGRPQMWRLQRQSRGVLADQVSATRQTNERKCTLGRCHDLNRCCIVVFLPPCSAEGLAGVDSRWSRAGIRHCILCRDVWISPHNLPLSSSLQSGRRGGSLGWQSLGLSDGQLVGNASFHGSRLHSCLFWRCSDHRRLA